MTRRVLIFGSSGFIGSHCVRRLHAAGKNIIAVDLAPPRERIDGVDYRVGDVRDLSQLDEMDGVATIYNFAAVHTTPGHPDHEYYDTNIAGAIEIIRLAERLGVGEIVFTSSISVYGPGEDTKSESSDLKPVSAYGRSKHLAEQIHRVWLNADAYRRHLIIVRPAVVFGPGERGNFTRMANLLRKGLFVFPGRRDAIKACIYVDDLLDSIEFARSLNQHFILFNGSYGQRYTLGEIVETFRRTYFPSAALIDAPLSAVMLGAKVLGALDMFKIGIHPDRVLKLVRSTDVVPDWLSAQGRTFPFALERALERWAAESSQRFD